MNYFRAIAFVLGLAITPLAILNPWFFFVGLTIAMLAVIHLFTDFTIHKSQKVVVG